MEREELKQTLQQLHQQLQSGEPVDPQLAALLQQVSQEVILLASTTSPLPADMQKESLLDRMLGLTQEFEETHPLLAEAIGRVATAFSRIGI